jgi:glycosyltransferase involved in cell wall biosynthesis
VTDPRISVIVCTHQRPESLPRTLESLAIQDFDGFEVIVVDQSGDDRSREIVEEVAGRDPRFRYLHLSPPGLSRAYNAGVRAAVAPLCAFTDDDCVAPAGWLRSISNALAAHPHVDLLYGQVLLPADVEPDAVRRGVTPVLPIPERRVMDRRRGFRVFGMGANFAVRRAVFDRVGPFDEMLGGGGPLQSSQDFDFAYRVYLCGCGTLLEPDVVVYHYGFRSDAEWSGTMRSYGIGVGGFFTKHARLGDGFAARQLVRAVARAAAHGVKHLTLRGPGDRMLYTRSLLVGVRRSFTFAVDRDLRVYRNR